MIKFVFSINGKMQAQARSILLWTHDRLLSWSKSMAQKLIRVGSNFDNLANDVIGVWALRKRWGMFLDKFPSRRRLRELEQDYWQLYDEWARIDKNYQIIHAKYTDLFEELRYWESKHSKVLAFIEKQMELTEGDLKK